MSPLIARHNGVQSSEVIYNRSVSLSQRGCNKLMTFVSIKPHIVNVSANRCRAAITGAATYLTGAARRLVGAAIYPAANKLNWLPAAFRPTSVTKCRLEHRQVDSSPTNCRHRLQKPIVVNKQRPVRHTSSARRQQTRCETLLMNQTYLG